MPKGHLNTEARLRQNVARLKTTNLRLRARITEQDKIIAGLQQCLETQTVQIAELQTVVFGKRKKPPTGHYEPNLSQPEPKIRTKASFRRPLPPAHAITDEKPVLLPDHCACGVRLTNISTHERFEEDIPLPELTPDYQAHLVTKNVIERGVCSSCGEATAGRNLGGQQVGLGSNIRLLICHLVTVVGLSYAQVIQLCQSLYGITLSDGEIVNTLSMKHQTWLPSYNQLKADIRSSPSIHADETSWPIQAINRQGYAWILAASNSNKSCFAL